MRSLSAAGLALLAAHLLIEATGVEAASVVDWLAVRVVALVLIGALADRWMKPPPHPSDSPLPPADDAWARDWPLEAWKADAISRGERRPRAGGGGSALYR